MLFRSRILQWSAAFRRGVLTADLTPVFVLQSVELLDFDPDKCSEVYAPTVIMMTRTCDRLIVFCQSIMKAPRDIRKSNVRLDGYQQGIETRNQQARDIRHC